MEEIKAVVQKIVRGKHGPYVVATSESIEGSITFSLGGDIWQEDVWPEKGTIVMLSKPIRKQAGWRAMKARFLKPSDEAFSNQQVERSNEMVCTLVISYNEVDGYPPGTHGNGRVVVLRPKRDEFKKGDEEKASFGLYFSTFNLVGRNIVDAYVYLGNWDNMDDPRLSMFQAMMRVASAHVKDHSRIHIVGCSCNQGRKEDFARHYGCDFIKSECGGEKTLGRIVDGILKTLPKEPKLATELVFEEEFSAEIKTSIFSAGRFTSFAAVGEQLFAGGSDGRLFWKKNGSWQPTELKLKQRVNLIVPDGQSVLVGDGSCCSGSTWRFGLDGTTENIVPVEGQAHDDHDPTYVRCNVYGFTRVRGELLTGGGGCAGEHIYRLNKDGKWEYHPKDPKKYVTTMMTASDGNAYIAMGKQWSQESIYRYDGKEFYCLGAVTGGVSSIVEHKNILYVCAYDEGGVYPTSFSNGYIYKIENGKVQLDWRGVGGIRGFFVHNEQLCAYGTNFAADWTAVLRLGADGKWQPLAKIHESPEVNGSIVFFVHNSILYAGHSKRIKENDKQESGEQKEKKYAAVISRVTGL